MRKFKLHQALSTISYVTFILLGWAGELKKNQKMSEKLTMALKSTDHEVADTKANNYIWLNTSNQKQPPKTWIQSFIFGWGHARNNPVDPLLFLLSRLAAKPHNQ